MEGSELNAAFCLKSGIPIADKPQGVWGTESTIIITDQAGILSSKKIINWEYASPQSLTGIVHFFAISMALR